MPRGAAASEPVGELQLAAPGVGTVRCQSVTGMLLSQPLGRRESESGSTIDSAPTLPVSVKTLMGAAATPGIHGRVCIDDCVCVGSGHTAVSPSSFVRVPEVGIKWQGIQPTGQNRQLQPSMKPSSFAFFSVR